MTLLTSEVWSSSPHARADIDPALPTTTLTENLVRIVVVILGLLVILAGLGLSITPMLTALGVGGLAVALALQDTLANLFAGVYLTVAKHIRIGNYIKLASGEEGYLVDIDWRASRLRQLSNNTVLVPNAKLSQSIVTNYDSPEHELVVTIEASADYASDLDRVEQIATDVARDVMRTVRGGVPSFDPLVRFHTLGDPGIGFSVILRAQEFVDQQLIKHEFVKRLHKRSQPRHRDSDKSSPSGTTHRAPPLRPIMSCGRAVLRWVAVAARDGGRLDAPGLGMTRISIISRRPRRLRTSESWPDIALRAPSVGRSSIDSASGRSLPCAASSYGGC